MRKAVCTKGQIMVRLTAILELNISMALTGTEHMIQRFFPSKDRDAEVVEVIVTNTAITSGSTCRSIWLKPAILWQLLPKRRAWILMKFWILGFCFLTWQTNSIPRLGLSQSFRKSLFLHLLQKLQQREALQSCWLRDWSDKPLLIGYSYDYFFGAWCFDFCYFFLVKTQKYFLCINCAGKVPVKFSLIHCFKRRGNW